MPAPSEPARGPLLTAVQVVDRDRVWVAGRGRILATGDGGATWTEQHHSDADFVAVDLIDANHGWAVARDTLWRTDDGRSWHPLAEPQGEQLTSVHFVDPSTGWGATAAGHLARTADGGRHWTSAAAPPGVRSACFVDSRLGWLATGSGAVLATTDGGAAWAEVLNVGFPSEGGAATVQCAAPHAAWAYFAPGYAGLSHSLYLAFQSTDGKSFHPVLKERYMGSAYAEAPQGPGSYPGPFSVVSATTAQFVGFTPVGLGQASLATATDDGRVLRPQGSLPNINLPTGASFATASRGWVVGVSAGGEQAGFILRTTDGGASWEAQLRVG